MLKLKNYIKLTGVIESVPRFSHETNGNYFYKMNVRADRPEGGFDLLPVTLAEFEACGLGTGDIVKIEGEYRSRWDTAGGRNHLEMYIFAKYVNLLSWGGVGEVIPHENSIILSGEICSRPMFWETASGRKACDFSLSVNRSKKTYDRIPCIAWNRNAEYISYLELQDKLQVSGRIQSRQYEKKFEDGAIEVRTAYEVSVAMI